MKDVQKLLTELLGEENVSVCPKCLQQYNDSRSFVEGITPFYEVFPASAEQVEALVKLANRESIPLVPVSSTGKHRRGGTVPVVPEAVMVNLSRMKNIESINKMFRIAVIEPGITYSELKEALKPYGLTIAMPLAPRAGKSVIASLLETEPRLDPNTQWASTDPLRCLEVVWGDGNRMMTGEAAGGPPDMQAQRDNDNWQIISTGPDMVDYIRFVSGAQGSLGTITKASVRCAEIPAVQRSYLVGADKMEDAIEFMYAVEHLRFSDGLFVLNAMALACLMGKDAEEIEAIRAKLPAWIAVAVAQSRRFAPEMRVVAHEKGFKDCAEKLGLKLVTELGGLTAEAVVEKAFSVWTEETYWKDTYKGASCDLFFNTTMERTPKYTEMMKAQAAAAGIDFADIGVYVQPLHQGINCHCEYIIPYTEGCPKCTAKAEKLMKAAAPALCHEDAFFYRPYGDWAKMQISKNAMTADTLGKIKKIFDGNNVMNPDKLNAY